MWYHEKEVNPMNQENFQQNDPDFSPEQYPDAERPRWQVWMARLALVLFLLFLSMYYANIFRGNP